MHASKQNLIMRLMLEIGQRADVHGGYIRREIDLDKRAALRMFVQVNFEQCVTGL